MDSDIEVTDYVPIESHSLPSGSLPITSNENKSIKNDYKQLSFSETVKLITDFSQELRKNINNNYMDLLISLKPLPIKNKILPKIDQRRFTNEENPTLICVKTIENDYIIAEELTRDISKQIKSFTYTEAEFSMLPYDCTFFSNNQTLYEDYCRQKNVIPFYGFRTIEDMRLFHCGFWLNNISLQKKSNPMISTVL